MFLRVIIPGRFNKFTSWVLSPVTTVLMVEDVSKKEQNEAEEMKTHKEVQTMEKCLISLSLFNLTIFTCYTLVLVLLVQFKLLNTDQQDIRPILLFFIFLPPPGLNFLSCLLMFFLPASASKGILRSLKTVVSLLIFSIAIILPLLYTIIIVSPLR